MIRILLYVKSFVSERCVRSDHKSHDIVCISYESYQIIKLYVSYDT